MVIDLAGLVATHLIASDFPFRVAPLGASGVVNPSDWANNIIVPIAGSTEEG
jgi:hypothetical protein